MWTGGVRCVSAEKRAGSSVRTATAPRATASSTNLPPSARLPASAAKRKPGFTWRESAVMPRISGLPGGMRVRGAWVPSMRSVSRNFPPLRAQGIDHQRTANFRRIFVHRLNSHQRRHALNDAADARRRRPTAGGEAVGLLGAVRFIDADHDEIARIGDREDADEGGEQFLAVVMTAIDLFGRAGFAADEIAGRRGEFAGALLDDEPQQAAHLGRGLGGEHLMPARRD